MLQVTNGSVTITVTKGAFKNFYERCGFHAVAAEDGAEGAGVVDTQPTPETPPPGDSSHQETAESGEVHEDADEDGEEDEEDADEVDLSEIPLGEMSFDQLNDYADQLELDHDGIRSKKELRALIREHLKK